MLISSRWVYIFVCMDQKRCINSPITEYIPVLRIHWTSHSYEGRLSTSCNDFLESCRPILRWQLLKDKMQTRLFQAPYTAYILWIWLRKDYYIAGFTTWVIGVPMLNVQLDHSASILHRKCYHNYLKKVKICLLFCTFPCTAHFRLYHSSSNLRY